MNKGLTRTIITQILIFLGLIAVTAAAMRPVQRAVHAMMNQVKTNLLDRVEDFTGMKLYYSSIRPSFFNSLEIRDIRLVKDENDKLYVSRIRISFSFTKLIRKNITAIYAIQIERPSIFLDTEKDSDLYDLYTSYFRSDRESSNNYDELIEMFAEHTEIKIKNGLIILQDGADRYHVSNIDIGISAGSKNINLTGNLNINLLYDGIFNRTLSVESEAKVSGIYSLELNEGSADILISYIKGAEYIPELTNTELFNINPLNINLNYIHNSLNVQTYGYSSWDALVNYNLESGSLISSVNFNNFAFTDVFSINNIPEFFYDFISYPLTGSSSFQYEKTGVMRYAVNLKSGDTSVTGDYITVTLSGSEKSINIDELRYYAPEGSLGLFYGNFYFAGNILFSPFAPAGVFSFTNFSLTGEEFISARYIISNRGNNITISSDNSVIGKYTLKNTNLEIYPSNNDISITVYSECEDEGNVSIDAILNYNTMNLDSIVSFYEFPVSYCAAITRLFVRNTNLPSSVNYYLENITLTTDIFFTTDFEQLRYNAPAVYFTSENNELFLSFSGNNRQFLLSQGSFLLNGKELSISADIDFANFSDIVFSVNAYYDFLSWQFDGQIFDGSTLIINDSDRLSIYGNRSNQGAFSGYIEGVNFPLPAGENPVYLNLYTTLRYINIDSWQLNIPQFELRRTFNNTVSLTNNIIISPADNLNYISFSAAADQTGALINNLVFIDNIGELYGNIEFLWENRFSFIDFNIDITDGTSEGEMYSVQGMLSENKLEMAASLSNIRLNRFTGTNDEMVLNGEISVSFDSLSSFAVELDIRSFTAKLPGNTVQASAGIFFSNEKIIIDDLNFNYSNTRIFLPELQINRIDNFAHANFTFHGSILNRVLESSVDLNADFSDTESWFDMRKAFQVMSVSLKTSDVYYDGEYHEPLVFNLSMNNGAVTAYGGIRDMIRLEMDNNGNFFAGLSSPFPFRASITGTYKDGHIDAYCGDFFLDMSTLWKYVSPLDEVNIAGGYITARLDIKGPINNPEFFGAGRASSFRLKIPDYVREDIRVVPFNVTLEGREMFFSSVPLAAGTGGGSVDAWFLFERWIPDTFQFNINIPNRTPVPYIFQESGFFASGDASGFLSIRLDNKLLEVNGDLLANNTESGIDFVDSISFTEQRDMDLSPESEIQIQVNLKITTGTMVEFIWPNSSMPILRAAPRMGTVLDISVDTAANRFSLNSDIVIRSGELYYFDRNFYIRQGNLVLRENEQSFNPRITATAEIREYTDTGPVTIRMVIENEELFGFVPSFESNPSLTQLEIYSILGHNLFASGATEETVTDQYILLASTTDLLFQFLSTSEIFNQVYAIRTVERYARNFLRLDIFSIRTRFLQNVITNTAYQGITPVDTNYRIGNYFNNSTVFIGKYIGQDLFLSGMLTMRYNEYNPDFGGVSFEPDIGIEMQTPFLNIRWDFFPNHPENFWVNDNSITLTWSRSF